MKCLKSALLVLFVTSSILGQAYAAKFTAKIGHLESTQQSRHIHLLKVADLVKQRTHGEVEFQIFPQSQLGNQRQMTEGVQLGAIEATIAPAAFLGGFNPLISILDIPYLYPPDFADAQKLRTGKFGQELLKSFKNKGVVAISFWPNGSKDFTSSKPLNSIADFAGQKFRVMDSKILIEQFNALGASAVALPFGELYTSLQTGVVDGEENPLDTIQRMKFHEVQKYLVVSRHGMMEDVILFSPFWWSSLPENYKTIITDTFLEMVPQLQDHKENAIKEALNVIKSSDINVRIASQKERNEFREKMLPPSAEVYKKQNGSAGKALFDLYLQEYNDLDK